MEIRTEPVWKLWERMGGEYGINIAQGVSVGLGNWSGERRHQEESKVILRFQAELTGKSNDAGNKNRGISRLSRHEEGPQEFSLAHS